MNIVNQTNFDESLMKRFACFWSSLFKKHRFLNWIYYGIALLLVVLIVVMSVVNWGIGDDTDRYFVSGLYLLLTVFWVIWRIFYRKKLARTYQSRGISCAEYIFHDENVEIQVQSEKISAKETYSYQMIKKVWETSGEFYIYTTAGAFIVAKIGFSSTEDENAVRDRLRAVAGKKYILSK
ncbi:MAG: YcxB family protein [Clostridiales bacterium]|nr:YcxB family protein [Clostridiales bacterium]